MNKERVTLKDKTFELFLSQEEIEERITMLAESMNKYPREDVPVFLVVLKGSFMFASELLQRLNFDCEIHFVRASSYRGMERGDSVESEGFEGLSLSGREVYIIEDIVDSGNTLTTMMSIIKNTQPKSVKILTLLDKPSAHLYPFTNITSCFKISNEFVVGYGLDYDQLGRNLPNIYQYKNVE